MSEPWKCNCCGKIEIVGGKYQISAALVNHPDVLRRHVKFDGCQEGARFEPYDRRIPDPRMAALMKKCILEYMQKLESWGHDGKMEKCNLCQEYSALAIFAALLTNHEEPK